MNQNKVRVDFIINSGEKVRKLSALVPKNSSVLEATKYLPIDLKLYHHEQFGTGVMGIDGRLEKKDGSGWQFYVKRGNIEGLPYTITEKDEPKFPGAENITIDKPVTIEWKYENYKEDIKVGGCAGARVKPEERFSVSKCKLFYEEQSPENISATRTAKVHNYSTAGTNQNIHAKSNTNIIYPITCFDLTSKGKPSYTNQSQFTSILSNPVSYSVATTIQALPHYSPNYSLHTPILVYNPDNITPTQIDTNKMSTIQEEINVKLFSKVILFSSTNYAKIKLEILTKIAIIQQKIHSFLNQIKTGHKKLSKITSILNSKYFIQKFTNQITRKILVPVNKLGINLACQITRIKQAKPIQYLILSWNGINSSIVLRLQRFIPTLPALFIDSSRSSRPFYFIFGLIILSLISFYLLY